MLPFTHEQFLAVFAAYNQAVWPAPVAAYAVALAMCFAIATRRPAAGAIASSGLAAMWLWTGVAYHWIFFSPVNPAARIFAAGFVAEGILMVVAALRGSFVFSDRAKCMRQVAGWGLIAYSMLLYPVLGAIAGLHYPAAPVFGIAPCPVTLFSFGILLLARRVPWWLLPLPVAWSLVGGSAAWQLAIPQDWILLASAAAAIPLVRQARRREIVA